MIDPERHLMAGSFQTARIKNEWGNCATNEREAICLPHCVFLHNNKDLCSYLSVKLLT